MARIGSNKAETLASVSLADVLVFACVCFPQLIEAGIEAVALPTSERPQKKEYSNKSIPNKSIPDESINETLKFDTLKATSYSPTGVEACLGQARRYSSGSSQPISRSYTTL